MAGLSLSGDLKNPGKSIPLGSIAATLTGFAVYLAIPFLLNMSADTMELRNDSLIWLKIVPLERCWSCRVCGAPYSHQRLARFSGAPRTLQAVSRDQVANRRVRDFISGKMGIGVASVLSIAIALAFVFLGDLNAVAQVVTMFFLTVYGTINIVAGLETLSGDPSWRPKFRVHWAVNIACGLACLWVMFLISPLASIAAICNRGSSLVVLCAKRTEGHLG